MTLSIVNILGATLVQEGSALDKLSKLSSQNWLNIAVALVVLILVIKVIQAANESRNKFVWGTGLVVITFVTLLTWTYNGGEPKLVSPYISKLREILPGKNLTEIRKLDMP